MSQLRNQLEAARRQYRSAQFPADLAEMIVPPAPHTTARYIWRSMTRASLVAAALALIVFGHLMIRTGDNRSWASTAFNSDLSEMVSLLWRAPQSRAEPMGPRTTAPAARLPDWLKTVEQPLADSGRFLMNVGKDLAHQADALVHMM